MISILKTALDIERLEKFKKAAVACYGLAISSTEENVIEFDEDQAARFRADLQALGNRLEKATTPDHLQHIHTVFRDGLRNYRDATHDQIWALRREVEAAAKALESFAGSTAARGDDYETELKRALRGLENGLLSERLEDIKAAIRDASAGILASFEQMRTKNQLAVAQLKDEIRLLHQKIQAGQRSASADRILVTWNQREIDDEIDKMLSENGSFCLILVVLRNLKILSSRHSRAIIEDALHSLAARSQSILGGALVLGQWTENQFVAILHIPPARAMEISREVAQKLMEPYSFRDQGTQCTLSFQVAAGMIDHQAGGEASKFRARLDKLSVALSGVHS